MTKLEDLKKSYQEISKKHKLPDFNSLNSNFELALIDLEKGELLNSILRMIIDRMNNHLDFIYPAVNPNQNSIYAMQLYSHLSEKDKEEISNFYSELISLQLEGMKSFLEGDKFKADFITKMVKLYPGMLGKIRGYAELFMDAWDKVRKNSNQKEKRSGFTG